MKVVLDNEAKKALAAAYIYIRNDSLQSADKFKNEVLKSIKELIKYPEKYPSDKYRIDKDTSYRAYEI